ncbi:hypothetical protein [Shewanella polaris]|uniref:Uncharacterized protein n=1 Tax=Shewanella polaris TaxID=2588449 RepID=A0A4Y5YGQ7_9GAMM|nr:hypothetical protein [Shewanella polaris]QDE31991.1 hypothetical protein FH971_14095 [Shewanella polaris]
MSEIEFEPLKKQNFQVAKSFTNDSLNYLVVGEKYHLQLPVQDGACAEFLRASNRLIIMMKGIDKLEALALRRCNISCGILAKNGAILLLWQFHDNKGRPVLTLDSPFDARIIKDIQLHNIENNKQRLLINVHIVDSTTKEIKVLRAVTMSPELTIEFLSKVQEQISSIHNGEAQMQVWMSQQPCDLIRKIKMHQMGI